MSYSMRVSMILVLKNILIFFLQTKLQIKWIKIDSKVFYIVKKYLYFK